MSHKVPKKRSRNGCFSCKKLKIKCDESKPKCEYCTHTGRMCEYPDQDSLMITKPKPKPKTTRNIKSRYNLESVKVIYQNSVNAMKHLSNPNQYFTFDQLVSDLNVSPTTQLRVTKFELRLVNFFHEFCIPLFSFGVNKDVHNVWKNHVPSLFLQSDLVRKAILSFATLNLLPLTDLQRLQEKDSQDDNDFDRERASSALDILNSNFEILKNKDTLMHKTSAYFMDVISSTSSALATDLVDEMATSKDQLIDPKLASELTVSSILIYSFLCLHPYKMTPLVSFDGADSDLLSMARGVRNTLSTCAATVKTTNFRGLFTVREEATDTPPLERSTYPIIVTLREELDQELAENEDLDLNTLDEHNTLRETISVLHQCVSKCAILNYPVPLFRWLLIISDEFHDLVYRQHFFAIRILFVYSTYSILTRFEIDNSSNVWIDFSEWYKQHNYKLFGVGNWRYSMDYYLYMMATSRVCLFPTVDFRNIGDIDPASFWQNFDQSKQLTQISLLDSIVTVFSDSDITGESQTESSEDTLSQTLSGVAISPRDDEFI